MLKRHTGQCDDVLEGSELTKEDRESLCMMTLEHFRQNKGETSTSSTEAHAKREQDDVGASHTPGQFISCAMMSNVSQSTSSRTEDRGNSARGAGAGGYWGEHRQSGNANPGHARQVKYFKDMTVADASSMSNWGNVGMKSSHCSSWWTGDMLLMKMSDEILFRPSSLCGYVFQVFDCDAVLSEVKAHDHLKMLFVIIHENIEMHDDVRQTRWLISHAVNTSDSNMTSYDQYVKDNEVPVVQNNASMVPNDAYVMIDNDLHDSDVRSVSHTPRNTVANNLLNAELAL
ncbi:hypothetical protein Tco_1044451 [Tanacetum coccineum]|uniref:Uncharacterized protein n=1 Tax=Tanacetum coccineum TaxID=301880 RepID=A0ABQ5GR73_9ASTR